MSIILNRLEDASWQASARGMDEPERVTTKVTEVVDLCCPRCPRGIAISTPESYSKFDLGTLTIGYPVISYVCCSLYCKNAQGIRL